MRFAIIGTGFVADYYMTTMANHPSLELAGVFDIDAGRLDQFARHYGVARFGTLDAALSDETVGLVAILTTPETHFDIAKAALESGKHVYCEKPLAMDLAEAERLVDMARANGLVLGGAPANALSDAFRLTHSTLAQQAIGAVKLVYAEMEDGPVFRENWRQWKSVSGAPWPGKHEFEIGCTLEHAGYGLSWLIGLFGSIASVTGTSGTFFVEKGADIAPDATAPDFSTACLTFESGVVARLTCGLCAPKDRSMTIMGTEGTLVVADLWDHRSAVHLEETGTKGSLPFRVVRRLESKLGHVLPLRFAKGRKLAYASKSASRLPAFPSQIDFCAGISVVADSAAGQGVDSEVLAATALHVTEAALALNRISDHGGHYTMTSRLPPMLAPQPN